MEYPHHRAFGGYYDICVQANREADEKSLRRMQWMYFHENGRKEMFL